VAVGSIGGIGKDEAQTRKVFEFAKTMGILTVCGEPVEGSFEMLDKLANEYGIPFAIHNHPKQPKNPNYKYWSPDYILECCKGRSPMIGSCADTGHWMRSGLNPVECLKKLEGHVISLHIKDLDKMGEGAHDVPFGTGAADMKSVLEELRRQNFDGVMSMEYEYNWTTSVPEIAQCVAFVKAYGEKAGAAPTEKAGKKGGKKGGKKKATP
jgi:sugar phosphate isomerase/epimerase